MKLSFVIPCYNMEIYLPKCVDSLLKQSLKPEDYEIIIVNDESKDKTLQIANNYAQKHPNISVVDKKNAGVGAARNSGLDHARGTYVYFLDPDDYLAINTLPLLLAQLEHYNLEILAFKSTPVYNDNLTESANKSQIKKKLEVKDGLTFIGESKFQNEIWWYIIQREFLLSNNFRFIEGKWMEDAILTAELFTTVQKIAYWDIDVHRYRILPTSAMRNKSPEHYNKVIYDNANAAEVFYDLLKKLPTDHPNYSKAYRRLKTRQQSFVFFLLVRLMKSDIAVTKIPDLLKRFEKIDAYPLKKFLGKDYNGWDYKLLVFIFNRKKLIIPFTQLFRLFYNLKK
ncbi:glycosyltransferase [Croceivirga sp. JEA036]|uniref:glycosyltransferase n=1 Tax=Croceivirga sp. JEA036 TaxID=2721162 RepID=UPI001439ADFB|nr:glycosyltransferase [Croceivirga sp. JEA036]NJB35360.1 glycosyltransferase [Croceivirga sp. JEA036]